MNNGIENAQENTTEVPDVRHLSVTAAIRLLKESSLKAKFIGDSGKPNVIIRTQTPKEGTFVRVGSAVTLTLMSGPAP
jgi:beta-lactam-binding protein with PASTA domain